MRKKFYVDTSVWIDLLEDRSDGIRPLGEFAFQFLVRCKNSEALIIVSDIVENELRLALSEERLQLMFADFAGMIVKTNSTREQAEEARDFLKKSNRAFPLYDILHSIIARDEGAILVSRDRHFSEINLVEARTPEELP